jgi:hypothetical protein
MSGAVLGTLFNRTVTLSSGSTGIGSTSSIGKSGMLGSESQACWEKLLNGARCLPSLTLTATNVNVYLPTRATRSHRRSPLERFRGRACADPDERFAIRFRRALP